MEKENEDFLRNFTELTRVLLTESAQESERNLLAAGKILEEIALAASKTAVQNSNDGQTALASMLGNDEVNNMLFPVVASLQYQERLRQYLLNLANMATAWQANRTLGKEELGQKLFAQSTTREEREVLRKHFSTLPPEEKVDTVTLFD